MEKPASLQFTDLEVSLDTLFPKRVGPMNLSWTRVQFSLPDPYEAPKKVQEWLRDNCPGRWTCHAYQDPRNRDNTHIMVVRFADKNDALMFKLRGGHQAHEQS